MNVVSVSLLKAALLAAGSLAILSLASCNTFEGFGRDVQNLGSGLQNAANR